MKLNMKGQNLMVGMVWYGLFWWGDKILSHMYKKKSLKNVLFFPLLEMHTHTRALCIQRRENVILTQRYIKISKTIWCFDPKIKYNHHWKDAIC